MKNIINPNEIKTLDLPKCEPTKVVLDNGIVIINPIGKKVYK